MSNAPQPFDPGYDYEADKAIEDRLKAVTLAQLYERPYEDALVIYGMISEAANEIRALRLLIKNMEKTINNLVAEREAEDE